MRRAFVLVVVATVACGGGDAQSGGVKHAKNGGGGTKDDDSIADLASREGLPSLGGSGSGQSGGGGGSLRLELSDKDNPIRLDGVTKEWTLVPAHTVTKGTADQLSFKCGLAYDANYVYFASEVGGVTLRHARRFAEDEDHASLIVVAPGGGPVELTFYAGKPGELAGVVRLHGRDVPGAKLVEAESEKGYSFEAQIPWSALAPPTVRVGLRGVARFHDGTRAILASGNGDAQSPNDMPALPTESEEALLEQFLIPKGLSAPKFELLADIRGDAMKERVAIYDRYLTVVGPNYRDGKEFFYRDLGADVLKLEARELTGRGKQDLVIRRQFAGEAPREWLDVWSFMSDEPTVVFSHEISVARGSNHVTNAVRLAQKEIEVAYDPAIGWDATSYKEPRASDTEPVLLPWGQVKAQTFRFDGSKFAKAREVTQAGVAPATQTITTPTATVTTTTRVEPPTPVQHAGGDLSAQLLAKYRADRGNADRPRVDVQVHVDGDARPERVMLIGRDVVVFGPGFKGGNAYAYITLSQFADASDIEEMTARDLTGDGAADLIVRGTRHVSAQNAGTIDMHVMFVYQLKNEVITRVFGIETARAQGTKRIQGLVQMIPGAGHRGFDIDVRPGRAQGWTDKTYPFTQDQPGGALEPLLLPWGGTDHLRYTFNGTTFAKSP
jgi:hypothetical protein